jgi:hypothetical protein
MPPANFYTVVVSMIIGKMFFEKFREHRNEQAMYDREFADITANYE